MPALHLVLFIALPVKSGTCILAEEIWQVPVLLIYASSGPLHSEGLSVSMQLYSLVLIAFKSDATMV